MTGNDFDNKMFLSSIVLSPKRTMRYNLFAAAVVEVLPTTFAAVKAE